MDTETLAKLAARSRSAKEAGVTLLIASGILGFFIAVQTIVHPSLKPDGVAAPEIPNAYANVKLVAKSAIVYDLATNETLYAYNTEAQLPLASLTKLLTVYAALAELSPNTPITVPAEALKLDTPRAFNEGQIFSLADMARLTLTASLNDGAYAIARATAQRQGRSEAEMLAGAAASLNLDQTYAVNGSGLDESTLVSGAYGSAHDLAILAGALLQEAPQIAYATTQPTASAVSVGKTLIKVSNTDPVVETVPHVLLSKTGFTDLAGGNLVLVFDVGIDHPIAVVVLGSSKKDRFTDGTALVNATITRFADLAAL